MAGYAGYTKLFNSILHSTIWSESLETKIVWITMLAMCDKDGAVYAAIPGLARTAGVTVEQTDAAIARFQQPDKYSRTPDFEGRRIEPIKGGWRLLNHASYRELMNEDDRREYNRLAKQKERDKKRQKESNKSAMSMTVIDLSAVSAHTDTDTDTDTDSAAGALHKDSLCSVGGHTKANRVSKISCENFQKTENLSPEMLEMFPELKDVDVKKSRRPKVPKVAKQTNGYNAIELWITAIGRSTHIQSPKVSGFETKYLAELGTMYREDEFRGMLRAYAEDHVANGKPWRLFDEFYKCHAHWRSKAKCSTAPDPGSEESINALIAGYEGHPNANKVFNGTSDGNQTADESNRRIQS